MYTILRSIVCVYVRLSHVILVQIKKIKNKVNLDCGDTITFLLSVGGGLDGVVGRSRAVGGD